MKRLFLAILLVVLVSACAPEPKSNSMTIEQQVTEANQKQLNLSQPVPKFDWSQDRDTLIQIYQLRNEAHNTWTVFLSDMGTPLFSCPSFGFPIPGGTQLTNPQQLTYRPYRPYDGSNGYGVITGTVAQAEPNGLYTDPNTNSTWVLCIVDNGATVPVYSEPKVMTFPFPVDVKGGEIVATPGGKSSIKVQTKKST